MCAFVACVEYGVCCSAKPCVICVTQSCARPNCDRRLLLCIQQTRHIIQRHGTVKQSFTILYIFWPWCKTMIMMRHVRDPVSFATHLFFWGGLGGGLAVHAWEKIWSGAEPPNIPNIHHLAGLLRFERKWKCHLLGQWIRWRPSRAAVRVCWDIVIMAYYGSVLHHVQLVHAGSVGHVKKFKDLVDDRDWHPPHYWVLYTFINNLLVTVLDFIYFMVLGRSNRPSQSCGCWRLSFDCAGRDGDIIPKACPAPEDDTPYTPSWH